MKDDELNQFAREYQSLLKSKDILEREGDKHSERLKQINIEMNDIKRKIDERTRQILNGVYEGIKQEELKEENKMTDEIKVEEVKPKEPKKVVVKEPRQNTLAAAIEKTLLMKSIKDINSAIEKVMTIMPDKEKGKVKNQIKNIIRAVSQGKQKRWQKYTWDKPSFSLIEK